MIVDDEGHDIYNYLIFINENAGYSSLDKYKLIPKDLKKKVLINLVNPFIVYSIYTTWKTYLWAGEKSLKFPTFKFNKVEYLPSFRISFTPFGIQYHWENYLKFSDKILFFDIPLLHLKI